MLGKTSHSHVAVFDFLRERGGLKSFAGSMVRDGLRLLARSKVKILELHVAVCFQKIGVIFYRVRDH